ncbi:hypothetical protein OH805_37415 [Streptomyces sp. NBC_00879]|uniref:hypothetical protein n=1 Tax=Streptomyces sp. NBC_00879 TaxID=2975855 RepID=UPI003867EB0C|nr:hypothetical protein OH805_37415 [Streptomyces sp. NBC_00879]
MRRACLELSSFLEVGTHGGGHDPGLLRAEHVHRFLADQRHRARHLLRSLIKAARSNLRFQDRRVAGPEARLTGPASTV